MRTATARTLSALALVLIATSLVTAVALAATTITSQGCTVTTREPTVANQVISGRAEVECVGNDDNRRVTVAVYKNAQGVPIFDSQKMYDAEAPIPAGTILLSNPVQCAQIDDVRRYSTEIGVTIDETFTFTVEHASNIDKRLRCPE
jgi:hypothetical protein